MKLTKAELRRYRSIEDAGEFDVEHGVTCLVGKNESGKTAVLKSLYKSHPVSKDLFDEGLDYPSRLSRELKGTGPFTVSRLTYELSQNDVEHTEATFGRGVLTSRNVVVTTGYRYDTIEWEFDANQLAVVEHLSAGLDLPGATVAYLANVTTVADVVTTLKAMETPLPSATAVIETVEQWPHSSYELAIRDLLAERRPPFVYFGDYDSMPGKVSIPDMIEKRDTETLSRGEQAVAALLDLAGVQPEDLLDPESHEHLVRHLENASNSISDEVFQYWTQNKDLSVRLQIMPQPERGAVSPLDRGPLLQIRVVNQRHSVSVPFDERSRGFVWFFSFLAYFSDLEANSTQPLVLLLDEPGLNLHATAQADLLRFIDQRLAPQHQVLFSTHSPFMVDAHHLDRVRTVVDDEKRGTLVSSDVLRADTETAFPLHAALGIELSQTLFVGPDVLLVEGYSDLLYLEALSQTLTRSGRQGLQDRWVIAPARGIAKLPALVTLLAANKLNTVVLADSSSTDGAPVERLREAGRLGAGGLVEISEITGSSPADIEDLFEPAFYLRLVNVAYAGELHGAALTLEELPADKRLVRRVERAFHARGINGGRLNHLSPARALTRDPLLSEQIDATTLEQAERLFNAINAFQVA